MKNLFMLLIQTAVIIVAIQEEHPYFQVACVMAAAMYVPEDALPDNLVAVSLMAIDFVEWQCNSAAKPEWYRLAWAVDQA